VLSSIPSGRGGWDETEDSNDQEDETEDTANVLTILTSYWLKKLRLWQAYRDKTSYSQRERRFGV